MGEKVTKRTQFNGGYLIMVGLLKLKTGTELETRSSYIGKRNACGYIHNLCREDKSVLFRKIAGDSKRD